MAKCLANACRNYQQWRDERPNDYQLWREVLTGAAPLANAERLRRDENDHLSRDEVKVMDLTPRDCYGTLVIDANGEHEFLDISADRDHLRQRIGSAYEVRRRLDAIEKTTHRTLTPPLNVGTVYIDEDGRANSGTVELWECVALEA